MKLSTKKIDTSKYLFSNIAIIALIVPLVIEQLLSFIVGLADSIMVSRVGESAVSAISLIDNIMFLIIFIFSALATGGAVVAGQYMGQKNAQKSKEAANELLWFTTIISVVMMILIYVGKWFILNVVFGQISQDVYDNAETYLMIVALSIPFVAIYSVGAAIFRTMGNSRVSMNISIIMNIINVVGNAICIYGLKWGVAGAAIPTVISRIVAAVIIIKMLFDQSRDLYIDKTLKHKFEWGMIKRILGIGIPSGLENGMFQLGKIILLSLVSTFGTAAITANAITSSIVSIQVIPGMAISLAMTTVISRCVGAKDYDQVKYYNKKLLIISYITMFIFCTLIALFIKPILGLYDLSAETMELTELLIYTHTVGAIILWPTAFNIPSTLRAAGDVKFAMTFSIISMWVFRLLCAYLLAKILDFGVLGVWLAMMIDWVFRCIVFVARYKKGKWKNHSII